MKHTNRILLGSLLLVGLHFAGTGCIATGGGGGGVIYGDGPWFQDAGWLDGGGRGWYGGNSGGGAYVHPSGGDRSKSAGARPSNGARAASGGNRANDRNSSDDHRH